MKALLLKRTLPAIAMFAMFAPLAQAQQTLTWIGDVIGGDGVTYQQGLNWDFASPPSAAVNEVAKIGADPGFAIDLAQVAQVSSDLSATPSPRLVLGEGSGYSGTLNITSTGNLVITNGLGGTADANLNVGLDAGLGVLNVTSGTLAVGEELSAPTSADAASTIALSGSASVSAGSAFLDRNLTISGNGVSFAVSGDAILGGGGVHQWEFAITGGSAGPSAISVVGQLDLGGTLKVDTMGETPTIGQAYVIADSGSVVNGFGNVDVSEVPGIGLGVSARAVSAAGGTNGVETSVLFEQQPVVVVNRQTGDVSLRNPNVSSGSLEFDVYTIGSGSMSLDHTQFDGLADGTDWQEANLSASSVSELNPVQAVALFGGTNIPLGKIFQPAPGAVGDNREDLAFRFAPDGQDFVNGVVVYEGIPTDTLTLNVDRTNGQAQILNGFGSAVSIDAYVIESESSSIIPSTSGSSGLAGDWQFGANTANVLSELNPAGELTLASNAGQALGLLYDQNEVFAMEDFSFRFALPGENFFRNGKVVFDDELTVLDQVLQGDFNNDNVVDAADYTLWRDNLGGDESAINNAGDGLNGVDQQDYLLWRANYGMMAGQSAPLSLVSAPEPTAVCLTLLAVCGGIGLRRRG